MQSWCWLLVCGGRGCSGWVAGGRTLRLLETHHWHTVLISAVLWVETVTLVTVRDNHWPGERPVTHQYMVTSECSDDRQQWWPWTRLTSMLAPGERDRGHGDTLTQSCVSSCSADTNTMMAIIYTHTVWQYTPPPTHDTTSSWKF